ncbi:MAG: hypothetical protein RIC14_08320 [Filomicrobium sp.]
MTITATYASEEQTTVLVSDGTIVRNIPVNPENVDYQTFIASGVPIAPYVPPPVNVHDIRQERDRRLWALVGATRKEEFDELRLTATMEGVRLLNKGQQNWTPEEAARAFELEALEARLVAIRAKAAELEETLPPSYQDDSYWETSGT